MRYTIQGILNGGHDLSSLLPVESIRTCLVVNMKPYIKRGVSVNSKRRGRSWHFINELAQYFIEWSSLSKKGVGDWAQKDKAVETLIIMNSHNRDTIVLDFKRLVSRERRGI